MPCQSRPSAWFSMSGSWPFGEHLDSSRPISRTLDGPDTSRQTVSSDLREMRRWHQGVECSAELLKHLCAFLGSFSRFTPHFKSFVMLVWLAHGTSSLSPVWPSSTCHRRPGGPVAWTREGRAQRAELSECPDELASCKFASCKFQGPCHPKWPCCDQGYCRTRN